MSIALHKRNFSKLRLIKISLNFLIAESVNLVKLSAGLDYSEKINFNEVIEQFPKVLKTLTIYC